MDISLPVSESSSAGVLSNSASTRSAGAGENFSRTLSQKMAERPEQEQEQAPVQTATNASQATQQTASSQAPNDAVEARAKDSDTAEDTTEHEAGSGKTTKKPALDAADAVSGNVGATPPTISADEQKVLDNLKLLAGYAGDVAGDSAGNSAEIAVTKSASDTTAKPAHTDMMESTDNPVLSRSNGVHNEMFNSLRKQHAGTALTGARASAAPVASGKSLQGSGKNLPVSGNTDKQVSSFLLEANQDTKYSADALITALTTKSATFAALSTQSDSPSAEAFALVNTGAGRSLLPQIGLKSELPSPASAYTSLASDFVAGSEEWCQDFGTKIEWLNNENITKAELSLHPAELGVLDITINTEDDRISINIVTHNEKSREMLESSLPRLTELLKSQGLALENSNISHNSSQDKHNAQAQQPANVFTLSPEEKHAAELGNVRSVLTRHQGQIDHYV